MNGNNTRGNLQVTDIGWVRSIPVEQYQPFQESGWSVPAGGETVLSVQVKLGEDGPEIRQWKTVYNGDWQAEDSLDLWDASDVAAP